MAAFCPVGQTKNLFVEIICAFFYYEDKICFVLWNRHIAVQETSVSWHHRVPIEGPPETPGSSQHYRTEESKEGPELVPHYAERHQSGTADVRFFHPVL